MKRSSGRKYLTFDRSVNIFSMIQIGNHAQKVFFLKSLPILYSFRRCPYAMRARLAINISGIEVELREILLRDKAPELLAVSPKATVPVLVQPDGPVIEESLDIMDWALAKNDPEHWNEPTIGDLPQMQTLIEQCETEFKSHLDRYKYSNRYPDGDGEKERDIASEYLWLLEKRLNSHEFLFGSRLSIADMAIVTFVRQFANVDRQWFDQVKWHSLHRWLLVFLESEQFTSIMTKYAIWKSGDEKIVFGNMNASIQS
jgi:glutathione S-transferase